MQSFQFANPAYLALLQGPVAPPVPPPLMGWPAARAGIERGGTRLNVVQANAGERLYLDVTGAFNPDYATYDLVSTNELYALYGLLGGTAAAHAINWLDPRDADAAFRLEWVGDWVHSATGAQGNGTNTRANTFFDPSVVSDWTNDSVGFYSGTPNEPAGRTAAGYDASKYFYRISANSGDGRAWTIIGEVESIAIGAVPNSAGFFQAQRAGSLTTLRRQGSLVSSYSPATLTILPTPTPSYVQFGCRANYSGSAGGFSEFSYIEQRLDFIGKALSEPKSVGFSNAVQAYQTRLGRAIS